MTADELKTLIDRLANTLQATLLLAVRLEADLQQSARDAADLLTSASQAGRSLVTPALPQMCESGRGDWIRTSDPLRPRQGCTP